MPSASNGRETLPRPPPERGRRLLESPRFNKGTAFTLRERERLGLLGLLPPRTRSLEDQAVLEIEHLRSKPDDLEKLIGLSALQTRNETLFHRVLLDNLPELLPIVDSPTIGLACQRYSHLFRQPQGLWISPAEVDRIPELLRNAAQDDVRLIAVTDNESILDLGDLGAGGIALARTTLALSCAAAGIHPSQVLPVSLDVGTDNASLLEDPVYLGVRHRRWRDGPYRAFVDAFVEAVGTVFPRALLQWEGLAQGNAFAVQCRHRQRLPSFSGDLQGWAAVVVAGILVALRSTGGQLGEQRILHAGTGRGAIEVGRLIHTALLETGASEEAARPAQLYFDGQRVVGVTPGPGDGYQLDFGESLGAMGLPQGGRCSLLEAVARLRPTILIGTAGIPGLFDEQVIAEMAKHVERPVIFPLGRPTAVTECTPAEALRWTQGRAVLATGSPFAPVTYQGRVHEPTQAHSVLLVPGLALGSILAEAPMLGEELLLAAAEGLSECVDATRLARGALYPPLTQMRSVSAHIAVRVLQRAREAGEKIPLDEAEVEARVRDAMWDPQYPRYDLSPAPEA